MRDSLLFLSRAGLANRCLKLGLQLLWFTQDFVQNVGLSDGFARHLTGDSMKAAAASG